MDDHFFRFCARAGCGKLIPPYKNGNTHYCSDECYDENKRIAAAEAGRKRAHQLILVRNDDTLDELFALYQSKFYISAKLLIDRGFNWDIHSGETVINGLVAKNLIRYGYTLFTNQTVQLWKL